MYRWSPRTIEFVHNVPQPLNRRICTVRQQQIRREIRCKLCGTPETTTCAASGACLNSTPTSKLLLVFYKAEQVSISVAVWIVAVAF